MHQRSEAAGSLVVFCWGLPRRTLTKIKPLAAVVERLLIIDPLANLGTRDAHFFDHHPKVSWIDAIPGPQDERVSFIRYSLPGLGSPTAATDALIKRYPGLIERGRTEVHQRRFETFIEAITPLVDPIDVIIDAPGAEGPVLDLLFSPEISARISHIHLRCGKDAFFLGSLDAPSIVAKLEAAGFAVVSENFADADWPELIFKTSPEWHTRMALEAELKDTQAVCETIRAEADQLRVDLAQARAEVGRHEEREAQLQVALVSANEECETRRTEIERLHLELSEARVEVARLDGEVTELQVALVRANEECETRRTEIERLHLELSGARTEMARLDGESRRLNGALVSTENQRDAAQSQLAIATRLQLLAANDLESLRSRFEESQRARTEIEKLMRTLLDRRRDAQGHFVGLNQQQDTGLDDEGQVPAQVTYVRTPQSPNRRQKKSAAKPVK